MSNGNRPPGGDMQREQQQQSKPTSTPSNRKKRGSQCEGQSKPSPDPPVRDTTSGGANSTRRRSQTAKKKSSASETEDRLLNGNTAYSKRNAGSLKKKFVRRAGASPSPTPGAQSQLTVRGTTSTSPSGGSTTNTTDSSPSATAASGSSSSGSDTPPSSPDTSPYFPKNATSTRPASLKGPKILPFPGQANPKRDEVTQFTPPSSPDTSPYFPKATAAATSQKGPKVSPLPDQSSPKKNDATPSSPDTSPYFPKLAAASSQPSFKSPKVSPFPGPATPKKVEEESNDMTPTVFEVIASPVRPAHTALRNRTNKDVTAVAFVDNGGRPAGNEPLVEFDPKQVLPVQPQQEIPGNGTGEAAVCVDETPTANAAPGPPPTSNVPAKQDSPRAHQSTHPPPHFQSLYLPLNPAYKPS